MKLISEWNVWITVCGPACCPAGRPARSAGAFSGKTPEVIPISCNNQRLIKQANKGNHILYETVF
jgi:hypothetical protein